MSPMRLLQITVVMLSISSAPVFAVNKCVDESGNVSYQQTSCPETDQSNHVELDRAPAGTQAAAAGKGNVRAVLVTLPGIGEVSAMSFAHWKTEVSRDGPAQTVRMRSRGVLSILLTYIPKAEPGKLSDEDHKALATQIGEPYAAASVEKSVRLRRMRTPIGDALLSNFNEARYQRTQPPPGEYSSITVGQIDHERFSVAVTILTQGPDTPAHDDALEVLASLLLIET